MSRRIKESKQDEVCKEFYESLISILHDPWVSKQHVIHFQKKSIKARDELWEEVGSNVGVEIDAMANQNF